MRPRLFHLIVVLVALSALRVEAQLTWLINNTNSIGGFTVTNYGQPKVISTPFGNAVWFNGTNSGLIIGTNPIADLTNFTVEMIFRPDPTNSAIATQPRIFHIQSPIPPDHRFTLEARITNQQWYGDVFLRTSAASSLTLITPTLLHPVGEWQHLAASYDGVRFRQFVNGIQETNGLLASVPLNNGLCTIGMRATTNNFFEGAVLALRFTGRALSPDEFMNVPVILLEVPGVNADTVQLDFQLAGGLPAAAVFAGAAERGGGVV